MAIIAVVNRKGGSGKSTLATHLAAWCAHQGLSAMLGDADRQQSAQAWLRRRSHEPVPALVGWIVEPTQSLRLPTGVEHAVIDTPGGMGGFALARLANHADAILIPVGPSAFDRESTAAGWAELRAIPRVASGRCRVAAVGMRIDSRTRGAELLRAWAAEQGLPYLGTIRETQAYMRCIERGLALFDMPEARVRDDLAQWQPILDWLAPTFDPKRAVELARARDAELLPAAEVALPETIVHRMPRIAPPVLKPRPAPSLAERFAAWITAPLARPARASFGAMDAGTLRELRALR